ncbi:MAG: hypothetical protein ACXWTS_03515 [Methylococcaceae bacterium]
MSKATKPKAQKRTVLIVGEGADEQAFLNYLKGHKLGRGTGLSIKILNAKGKGAKRVIEWTIRQAAVAGYDQVAALFDTDTDWTPAVGKLAKKHKILLLKSEPCFEAMMLRLLGVIPDVNSKNLKAQFSPYVNGDATCSENYGLHFNPQQLAGKQHLEPTITTLLALFKAE